MTMGVVLPATGAVPPIASGGAPAAGITGGTSVLPEPSTGIDVESALTELMKLGNSVTDAQSQTARHYKALTKIDPLERIRHLVSQTSGRWDGPTDSRKRQ